ncbi:hypothetical protein ACLSZD_10345 [[Pasteurella] aerogenes]|nr:hypothetical protein [[Pasteurella] aerogenes]
MLLTSANADLNKNKMYFCNIILQANIFGLPMEIVEYQCLMPFAALSYVQRKSC